MIVTCTSCQARFRIPDEKIGARGARVRCSKCKNVFAVRPPADSAPPPPADPFAAAGFGSVPAEAPAGPPAPAGDMDPFAAASFPPAATPPADPFDAPARPELRSGSHLPVTDLSDLGSPPASGFADPASLALGTAPEMAPPPSQAPGPPAPEGGGLPASADDLVLEERTPGRGGLRAGPPPLPASQGLGLDLRAGAGESLEPEAAVPGGFSDTPFAFGATDLAGPDPELGAAAGGAPPGAAFGADPFAPQLGPGELAPGGGLGELPGRTVTEPVDPSPPSPPVTRPAVAARRPSPPAPSPADAPRPAPPRRGRTHSLRANAVSLAALLGVAVGLLALLRGEGRFARLVGQGTPAAVEVKLAGSGLYERVRGRPILFVRGRVLSHSAAPLGRVVVRAALVRDRAVLARSEGLAGALPTPEELVQLDGPEGEARLSVAVAQRAPARIEPGGSLPFLLTFADYPEDLGGVSFRVSAEPARPARSP